MLPETYDGVAAQLPDALDLNYYSDRQSPWLLAHAMPDTARVRDLRQSTLGKLLDRPALRTLVSRCGGTLRRNDVTALAYSDAFDRMTGISPAGDAALDEVWGLDWMDFQVTFDGWAASRTDWTWRQNSRPGITLVVQLGFPTDHASLLGQLPMDARHKFECDQHPVRRVGRPTLAWARVDLDLQRGDALIEEVQCDWLRFVKENLDQMREKRRVSRQFAAHDAYYRALVARYAKLWPQVVLFAALVVVRDLLGLRRIWMHQPEAGATLKGIYRELPPRSLYTQLPKSFGFDAVSEVPDMLGAKVGCKRTRQQNRRLREVKRLRRAGQSIFWRLDL